MDKQLSVWSYYKPGFVDPLYAPYREETVMISGAPLGGFNGENPRAPPTPTRIRSERPFGTDTTWDRYGKWNNRSELVRAGWGQSFQRKFSTYPCPLGWESREDGWCVKMKPMYDGTFYTDLAPGAKPIDMKLPGSAGKPTVMAAAKSFLSTEETYFGFAPQSNYGVNSMHFGYSKCPTPTSYIAST